MHGSGVQWRFRLRSTFEDAIERLSEALEMMRAEPREAQAVSVDRKQLLVSILRRGEVVLLEARTYLDIATDPAIDLARQLDRARDEKNEIQSRLASYDRTCTALKNALDQERIKAAALQSRVDELTRERNKLDKKLDQILKSEPAKVYDAYAPKRPRK